MPSLILVYVQRYNFAYYVHTAIIEGCSEGEVRLAHGKSTAEGRVEVCINDTWNMVCGDYFSFVEAQILCAQLGFSKKSKII